MANPRPNVFGALILMTGVSMMLTGCPPPSTGAQMQQLVNAGVDTIESNSERRTRLARQAREAAERKKKQQARAEKYKVQRTFAEARRRQRLAAEDFQVRSGGESGGGGGNSGH